MPPTDADLDTNAPESDSDAPPNASREAPREYKFSLDTEKLREDIARGVQAGVTELFQTNRSQQPLAEETPLAIDENDPDEIKIEKRIHNSQIPLRKQMRELTQYGMGKISELTEDVASRDFPYWKEYRNEINSELARLDPAARTNRQTLQLIHDTVAMRHESERLAKAGDEARRAMNQDTNPPAVGGANGRTLARTGGNTEIPTPSDLFDEDQVAEIERRGGPDRFAALISNGRFKNWSDYITSRQKMISEPKKGIMGRTIPFRRPETKSGGGRANG